MKKILIAVDGGPTSEKVATDGYQLGKQLNAEIGLLSVVDTTLLMTEGSITPKEMAEILKEDLIKNQSTLINTVFGSHKIRDFVEQGKPYEEILRVAKEWGADMIVLGTHGRTGVKHLLMGSVAEKVLRHSTKPLFIVPIK